MIKNDFKNDLNYSYEDTILNDFYYKKGAVKIRRPSLKYEMEKGIDKIITFNTGCVLTVEEKKRRKDYGDMLIEDIKNNNTKNKGWIYTTQSDRIVYWITESKTIKILFTKKLQEYYFKHKNEFKTLTARNTTYNTINKFIPWSLLELNGIISHIHTY